MLSLTMLLIIIAGSVVGLVMGLTGAGGGILAVPALIYSQGWTMQQAMPVALLAVTVGAMIGAIEGFSKKLVRYRAGFVMALAGSFPTWLGVHIAHRISQYWLMLSFAMILLLVATRLFIQIRQHGANENERNTLANINANTGRFDWTPKTAAVIAGIGSIAGLSSGLLGVGGGFIIVPMLRHFTNVSIQGAVATSLFVISLVGMIGVSSALMNGAELPLQLSAIFVATTVAGTMLARRIVSYLPAQIVQIIFILLLSGVASSLLYRVFA
ncbi:sulfite exporter TauE/SafE family protein [Undibacterium sp. Dicai25W]|uniref:sulfite exporter TauE/SafE family protein n=1 Tax=Undibacterium sp. Dicai25W TaxID=3413034 RepID=UPI003BF084D7